MAEVLSIRRVVQGSSAPDVEVYADDAVAWGAALILNRAAAQNSNFKMVTVPFGALPDVISELTITDLPRVDSPRNGYAPHGIYDWHHLILQPVSDTGDRGF